MQVGMSMAGEGYPDYYHSHDYYYYGKKGGDSGGKKSGGKKGGFDECYGCGPIVRYDMVDCNVPGTMPDPVEGNPEMPMPAGGVGAVGVPANRRKLQHLCGMNFYEWVHFIDHHYPKCNLVSVKNPYDLQFYSSFDTQNEGFLLGVHRNEMWSELCCYYGKPEYCLGGWLDMYSHEIPHIPDMWGPTPFQCDYESAHFPSVGGMPGDGGWYMKGYDLDDKFNYAMLECCEDDYCPIPMVPVYDKEDDVEVVEVPTRRRI